MPSNDKEEPFYDFDNMSLESVNLRELVEIAQELDLDLEHRLAVLGDMDVSGFITKKGGIDDFVFPYLIIHGDFKCSKYSKVFPRVVTECFDCSNCGKDYIDNDTFIPLTREMNCAYSISNFDVLMGILPPDIEKIIVEPKLIKKDFLMQDLEHWKICFNFWKMYPNITVVDTKGNNLMDVFREIHQETSALLNQQEEQVEEEVKPKQVEEVLPTKTNGEYFERREVYTICRDNPDFEFLSDDDLGRLVRMVWSDNRRNGLRKIRMRCDDGAIVECITRDQLPLFNDDIKALLQEREKPKVKEELSPAKPEILVDEKPMLSEPTLKPIEIKKYIRRRDYNKVISSSGLTKAYGALKVINEINLDPLDIRLQGTVRMLKDGANVPMKVNTVKKEGGCCLSQSIDANFYKDPKRLVWRVADGPDGLIFVCVGFLANHNTQTNIDRYEEMRQEASDRIMYTEQDLDAFMEVEKLLNGRGDGGMPGGGPSKDKRDDKSMDKYYAPGESKSSDFMVADLVLSRINDFFKRR